MIIPYNTDAPVYHFPVGTLGLIAFNSLIFFLTGFGSDASIEKWGLEYGNGLHPVEWVTSIFCTKTGCTSSETCCSCGDSGWWSKASWDGSVSSWSIWDWESLNAAWSRLWPSGCTIPGRRRSRYRIRGKQPVKIRRDTLHEFRRRFCDRLWSDGALVGLGTDE